MSKDKPDKLAKEISRYNDDLKIKQNINIDIPSPKSETIIEIDDMEKILDFNNFIKQESKKKHNLTNATCKHDLSDIGNGKKQERPKYCTHYQELTKLKERKDKTEKVAIILHQLYEKFGIDIVNGVVFQLNKNKEDNMIAFSENETLHCGVIEPKLTIKINSQKKLL